MRSIQLRFAGFVGVLAALLIGASLTISSADARSFEAADETVTEAKLGAPDDDRPAIEKRGGQTPKRPKTSKSGKPSWTNAAASSGRGNGPPPWAPAFGRRAASTLEVSTLGRSDERAGDRDGGADEDRDANNGRSDISNTTLTTTVDADFIWPVAGRRLTTRFSGRHEGIDIGVSYAAVSAAAAGEVVFVGGNSRSGYGRYVDVQHADGYLTRYAHLSRFYVRAGDDVEQGEVIGSSGDTGYSTGPHLHFELHRGGSSVDPLRYLP